jgi:hypothetical protein
MGVAYTLLAAALAAVSPVALAVQPTARMSHERREGVAVLGGGVVWFNEGLVSLRSFSSGVARLGSIPTLDRLSPVVESSASAVVILERRVRSEPEPGSPLLDPPVSARFVAVVPPHPPTPIAEGRGVAGGGCERWLPRTEAEEISDFVVAGDDLVTTGECVRRRTATRPGVVEIPTPPTQQPVFIRSLNGGGWKVLRWLGGAHQAILAAEGDLLAIGEQITASRLRVLIVNVLTGQTEATFTTPDGVLSFAAANRLLLFEPIERQFPIDGGLFGPLRLKLYSVRGRALATLGVESNWASLQASAMHVLEWGEGGALMVRNLLSGERRPVIGFNSPGRSLFEYAFRWPALAIVQSTSPVLALPEISCEEGYYGPPSEPFLTLFDLERAEPYVPPIESPLESSKLLADCPYRLVAK